MVDTRIGPDSARDLFITLLRVRERLYAEMVDLLKKHGLTEPQFNVLRIIRGSSKDGLPCQEIGRRMITRVPDITRLLDRLEKEGLVSRRRSRRDRRVVMAVITVNGLKLLSDLDKPVARLHERQMAVLSQAEASDLQQLLKKLSP